MRSRRCGRVQKLLRRSFRDDACVRDERVFETEVRSADAVVVCENWREEIQNIENTAPKEQHDRQEHENIRRRFCAMVGGKTANRLRFETERARATPTNSARLRALEDYFASTTRLRLTSSRPLAYLYTFLSHPRVSRILATLSRQHALSLSSLSSLSLKPIRTYIVHIYSTFCAVQVRRADENG